MLPPFFIHIMIFDWFSHYFHYFISLLFSIRHAISFHIFDGISLMILTLFHYWLFSPHYFIITISLSFIDYFRYWYLH
jgi:hypothetical protein